MEANINNKNPDYIKEADSVIKNHQGRYISGK